MRDRPDGNPDSPRTSEALRIAYVCSDDPLNVKTWSGTPYHMLLALQKITDVCLTIRRPWPPWFDFLRRALRRATLGRIDIHRSSVLSRLGCRDTVRQLQAAPCDVVVVVGATPICAAIAASKPTVFVSDATFEGMRDYNPRFQILSRAMKRSGAEMESFALTHSTLALFPSDWALATAVQLHDAKRERCRKIPWGANLRAGSWIDPADRDLSTWRVLFVGVDWVGKGGDIALAAVQQLRAEGHNVILDVVGCAPHSPPPILDGVTFHGFLSKHDPAQRARLEGLFAASHLFILPTQFDAFPTVIAESASFGVPAVAYRTGGLTTNVRDGETGILIDEGAPSSAFAEAIENLLSEPDRYRAMCEEALRFSRDTLNWTVWAQAVDQVIREQLIKNSQQAYSSASASP